MQSDHVKEEIVSDDGFTLLGECSYRSDLDYDTIRLPAMRIIDTISFAKSTPTKLKEDERLLDHLYDLSESNDQNQCSIAKRILWIANDGLKPISEDEQMEMQKNIDKKEETSSEKKAIYQYIPGDYRFRLDKQLTMRRSDIVISYFQSNETTALRIYEELNSSQTNDIVALDANKIDPVEMASIIKLTRIVLICFSKDYRYSNASRLQATFAQNGDKHLIGLKVYEKYRLNGWLEKMLHEKNVIDFTKSDFNQNMGELKKLINEFKQ